MSDKNETRARWWDDIDLGLVLLLCVIPLTAYGCNKAEEVTVHNAAYERCSKADTPSETCKIILQGR